jgi:hypothetical protein
MDIEPIGRPEDPLNKLPIELLHGICDYLFLTHDPDCVPRKSVMDLKDPDFLAPKEAELYTHPLDDLAATCKDLRSKINDWTFHTAVQYGYLVVFNESKAPKPPLD